MERVPGLERSTFEITSPQAEDYNYIAWAAHDTERWWWPGGGFWPDGVPEQEIMSAFEQAYGTLGFEPCDGPELEVGYEKVVIYALHGVPAHAARQLPDGTWTSKLGGLEDVRHPHDGLKVDDYGAPVRYLRRRR